LLVAVCLIKLAHAEQVARSEAAQAGLAAGDVFGELPDHPIAPFGGGDLAADDFADLPVEIDQRSIDRLHRPLPGAGDELEDLAEFRSGGVVGGGRVAGRALHSLPR